MAPARRRAAVVGPNRERGLVKRGQLARKYLLPQDDNKTNWLLHQLEETRVEREPEVRVSKPAHGSRYGRPTAG